MDIVDVAIWHATRRVDRLQGELLQMARSPNHRRGSPQQHRLLSGGPAAPGQRPGQVLQIGDRTG
eukprot:SAG22_NODE_16421_length_325_cov_1.146018_1_plen_64_part_10